MGEREREMSKSPGQGRRFGPILAILFVFPAISFSFSMFYGLHGVEREMRESLVPARDAVLGNFSSFDKVFSGLEMS